MTMDPEPYYIVLGYSIFGFTKLLDGMPTPMLIEAGEGEAWQRIPGIWRLREPSDPPGTIYTRVRVARNPKYDQG
jgi:hypothetical protein